MDIFSLFGKIVFSVGGTGVIILGLSSWIGKIWADKLMQSLKKQNQKEIEEYKLKLAEQLEILKAKNDKLNYISKTQFDAEFKMYQELSEKSFLMLLYNELLFPRGIDYIPEDPDERQNLYKERYKTAKEALVEYQNLLYKFAPFISLDLYNMFEDLRKMGNEQIKWYPNFELGQMSADVVKELFDEKLNCSNRTKEMNDLHERIIVELRTYLNSLQIHED